MNQEIAQSKGDILIVDDIPENLEILFKTLQEQGYEVRRVLSGQQALMVVEADPPDLILLDVKMPHIDGYEVCRHLKAQEKTAQIPVIFLSALHEVFDKVKAFRVGGVDYITKPFHLEEVLSRIETQLLIQRQKVLLQTEILQRQKAEEALQAINKKLLDEIQERNKAQAELQALNEKLQKLATLDGLTQIANRLQFDQHLETEWKRLQREKLPLSLLLGDIDYFKYYNDYYGHLAGDECLRSVAQAINNSVWRPGDLVARYGGEEFAVILPNTDAQGATAVAQRILAEINALHLPHIRSEVSNYITLSLGIACIIPCSNFCCKDLVKAADHALYQAKAQGRNRIYLLNCFSKR
ncbi:response regulator receiver modulated diguanylate cyclase [Gloeothece citriformis PCC 7424]|uniref:Response regulator receiver modulated diguanylate cyclase n=1 Tax=Gloeothece citriformis (strain PCC 7424) TaxID=65393 RepID=B7KIN2_GLOC7|nr:diguanylate cyclase [Gloeothece citriformis]ACK69438.1 response regulator receiver modulated diguanylate cyclase [Gloeothece citriformis PCC 7424]